MSTCVNVFVSPLGGQATIEVTGVVIPQSVIAGQPFDIRVDYTNSGSSGGSFNIHLTAGTTTYDSDAITINPTTSQSLTLSATAPTSLGTLHVCAAATSITGGGGGANNICQSTEVTAASNNCDDADILCKLEYWVINNPSDAFLIAILAAAGVTTAYYMTRKGKGGKLPGAKPGKSQKEYAAQFA
jgi:hypothetical protein